MIPKMVSVSLRFDMEFAQIHGWAHMSSVFLFAKSGKGRGRRKNGERLVELQNSPWPAFFHVFGCFSASFFHHTHIAPSSFPTGGRAKDKCIPVNAGPQPLYRTLQYPVRQKFIAKSRRCIATKWLRMCWIRYQATLWMHIIWDLCRQISTIDWKPPGNAYGSEITKFSNNDFLILEYCIYIIHHHYTSTFECMLHG